MPTPCTPTHSPCRSISIAPKCEIKVSTSAPVRAYVSMALLRGLLRSSAFLSSASRACRITFAHNHRQFVPLTCPTPRGTRYRDNLPFPHTTNADDWLVASLQLYLSIRPCHKTPTSFDEPPNQVNLNVLRLLTTNSESCVILWSCSVGVT